jgi:hypothetical protein
MNDDMMTNKGVQGEAVYRLVRQDYASRCICSAKLRAASILPLAAKELDEERKDYRLIREAAEGTK